MQRIFVYGKETIPYSVLFSARRTLGIKVYPSGEVVLLAPERGRRRRSSSRNSTNGRRGFFGSRPFSQANDYLARNGITPVDWQIENIKA